MGQEFKPGQIIDLSQFDKYKKKVDTKKPEKKVGFSEFRKSLDEQLVKMSQEINDQYGYFVNQDVSVAMESYPEDFCNHQETNRRVAEAEKNFLKRAGENVSDLTPEELERKKDAWRESREDATGIVAEKVLALLFHKVMGKRDDGFLFVRSSRFDDYCHGIDTVIIDKESGNPICGVDEMGATDNDSLEKKGDKISNKIISRNGAFIQYGAIIKNGQLEKKALKNVPAFYLSLSPDDLKEVLPQLENEETSPAELKVFQRLVTSFEKQIAQLYFDFAGDYESCRQKRNELLRELEEIKARQVGLSLSQTDEGRGWKQEMQENNLRLNIATFKKSLAKMKIMAGLK